MKTKILEKYNLNYNDVRNVTLFVRVFDNKVRWAIMQQLQKKDYMNVTELYVADTKEIQHWIDRWTKTITKKRCND